MRSLRLAAYALPALLALTLAACGGDGDDEKITVYSGREEEYVGPLFDRFEEETGIELDVRYGETAELAATLIEEGENSPADLFFAQDAGALGALEKEGLFAPIPEDSLSRVEPRYRSPEGVWVGTSGRARVVGYNTEELSESDLPDSILDFTDPEWKGRIGWAPTNGSFQAFVTAMRLTEGEEATEEWLRGIAGNDPVVFDDNEAIRDAIASGEIDVGFLNHYYIAEAIAEEGPDYPVRAYHPQGDVGSLINVAGIGILESAGNAAGAEEFTAFALNDESQRYFADVVKEYPLVDGIPADPEVTPLAQIQQPDVELGELDDLQGTLELLQRSGAL
ncbi:MAG TPA: iron ABC transporter substrate-binding protein [Solirubrobacterales bacterium]